MFPFRYSSIFRSRWIACLWAAGICWTAYDFVPQKPEAENAQQEAPANAAGDALDSADMKALEAAVNRL